MIEKQLEILNEEGLHARPAGILVKAASAFQSKVEVKTETSKANAKSIMGLMGLGLTKGSKITLVADGADAEVAVTQLSELINNQFKVVG